MQKTLIAIVYNDEHFTKCTLCLRQTECYTTTFRDVHTNSFICKEASCKNCLAIYSRKTYIEYKI